MIITKLTGEIYQAYEDGVPVDVLSVRYHLSKGSILKKIASVRETLNPTPPSEIVLSAMPIEVSSLSKWNTVNIKAGIDRFRSEQGRMPTAHDFDEVTYLPSARQIQRVFGGLVKLREQLGYKDTDFTKGELRKVIAISSNKRGLTAEDYFEPLLIDKFGEPYVHVQKRYYKGSKNRYDFLVYAKGKIFGIDIFTTDRSSYIEKNVRHKISRYKNAPKDLDIYFVLVGEEYADDDVDKARRSIKELENYPNMHISHESEFLKLLDAFEPLLIPTAFVGFEQIESF